MGLLISRDPARSSNTFRLFDYRLPTWVMVAVEYCGARRFNSFAPASITAGRARAVQVIFARSSGPLSASTTCRDALSLHDYIPHILWRSRISEKSPRFFFRRSGEVSNETLQLLRRWSRATAIHKVPEGVWLHHDPLWALADSPLHLWTSSRRHASPGDGLVCTGLGPWYLSTQVGHGTMAMLRPLSTTSRD